MMRQQALTLVQVVAIWKHEGKGYKVPHLNSNYHRDLIEKPWRTGAIPGRFCCCSVRLHVCCNVTPTASTDSGLEAQKLTADSIDSLDHLFRAEAAECRAAGRPQLHSHGG